MVGKGSIKHNSRAFHAANTDPGRSPLNRCYCNAPIQDVYHILFDGAVERYNKNQPRKDRHIHDYYQKICSGKQEKPFHEIILQIGNSDNMNATSKDGQLAATILDDYMQSFQQRNLYLRVFSAHLHMDEATPHLHIDFVPFTTESERGLDTRVSLKQALANQGFRGGTRRETEWNQWAQSEKEQLAAVMARHGVQWEQKGTHEKHLSVLEYEKKMQAQEVKQLEEEIGEGVAEVASLQAEKDNLVDIVLDKQGQVEQVSQELADLRSWGQKITEDTQAAIDGPEWALPEPTSLMSAKTYKEKHVEPLISKLKELIRKLFSICFAMRQELEPLRKELSDANNEEENLRGQLAKEQDKTKRLSAVEKDYKRVTETIGEDAVKRILEPEPEYSIKPLRKIDTSR